MNPIELGKFLANLRNEKNLTQEELAEKLFIDKRKVSRWECGTSTPEFDILIRLSEILDVSLYELSICKRITNKKLSKRIVENLKSIKDYKRIKLKSIIKIVVLTLLLIFFSITTLYTFKNNGTVEIYDFESLDEEYSIDGNYIVAKNNNIFNITNIKHSDNSKIINKKINVCNFEIYTEDYRIAKFKNDYSNIISGFSSNNENIIINDTNKTLTIHTRCYDNKNIIDEYIFNFKLVKKYNNKLF